MTPDNVNAFDELMAGKQIDGVTPPAASSTPSTPAASTPAKSSNFDKMVGGEGDLLAPEEAEEHQTGIALANFSSHLDMDSSDLMIPRLRLTQGLTQEVQDGTATPGQWVMSGYDAKPEVTIVPILFARNRTLRDQEGSILCRSFDALTGKGEPGGVCETCVMNQWSDGDKGARVPPKCAFSYVYIVYVKEFETMALVEFRRTSIQAGKTLNTIAAQRDLGNFAVKLKSSKQTGKRGTFYQMVVQPVQAEPELLVAARQFMAG
jgi:hypothetical protein